MNGLFFLLLSLQLPFYIPDTLVYNLPQTVFPDRKGLQNLRTPQYQSLLLTTQKIKISIDQFSVARQSIPVSEKKLAYSNLEFKLDNSSLVVNAGALSREFEEFLSIRDSIEIIWNPKIAFFSYKGNNWTNYFFKTPTDRIKTYSNHYLTAGIKLKSFLPYIILDRIDSEHHLSYGISYFGPFGFLGFHLRRKDLFAFYSQFKLKDLEVSIIFDSDFTPSADPIRYEILHFDPILINLGTSEVSKLQISLFLQPFSIGFSNQVFSEFIVPDSTTFVPKRISGHREWAFNFGINSDFFTLNYSHLTNPLLKDTLSVGLYLREKYYDLNLKYSYRRHLEEINQLDLEILFKVFENLNPYVKIYNVFDSEGDYLPGITIKRRFVEVGFQLQNKF